MSVQPYLHLLDDVSGNRLFLRRDRAEQNRLGRGPDHDAFRAVFAPKMDKL